MKEWRESTSGNRSKQQEPPSKSSKCITFVPTDANAVPSFNAATLVRRKPLNDKEKELAVAGIPMHPDVLANVEDQNRKSYTKIELTFERAKGKSQQLKSRLQRMLM
jgi:hypothetical protein